MMDERRRTPHHTPKETAHRGPNGRFRNPWPGGEPNGLTQFLRWRRERRAAPPPADPDPSTFARATPSFRAPRANEGEISATWVGHSTVLVQLGGLNILTDPIWSDRASPLPWIGPRRWVPPGVALDSLPPLDLVLLSHNHYDHLDAPTVRALARRHPEAHWLVPLGLAHLLRRLGQHRITELDWWDEVAIGGARIASLPAQHFSARGPLDRMRTLWCGWTVRSSGRSLFFAGDTGYHPAFRVIGERYGPFDLSLLPIGAYEPRWFMRPVHMTPEEAVQAFQDANAHHAPARVPIALGIHWGTFKLTDEPMDAPPERMRAAWRAAGLPEESLWILAHGETRWDPPDATRPGSGQQRTPSSAAGGER
jgi:N-acyl-phosphatidylethanolamine-hydrolysing phospholipase D